MAPDDSDNAELTRYLLGEVSEAEQTQLEMRYFSDPQMFAELCAWRNDLIDRYVGGELSPELRDRFDAAIEKSWAMNERIRFAETLQEAMETHDAPRSRGAWTSLRLFIANHRTVTIDIALLLMIVVVVYLILRAFL